MYYFNIFILFYDLPSSRQKNTGRKSSRLSVCVSLAEYSLSFDFHNCLCQINAYAPFTSATKSTASSVGTI